LFGGVRSAVEGARATSEAQVWQLRDAEVSLSAEVANDYLALRALQVRHAVLATSIEHEMSCCSSRPRARAQGLPTRSM